MSGLDSRYVTSADLEPYFVSNQNGEALAGGIVTFYMNTARTTPKQVFELTQDSMTGAYSYAALPNPITLSGVGTFQDAGGNNVAVYYYPYDERGNPELYYITVYDAYGNLQFTREAWPYGSIGGSGGGGGSTASNYSGLTNQLMNPQFIVTFFTPPTISLTLTGSGTTTVPIGPGWTVNVTYTGDSSLTITQNPIVGQSAYPFNPPFTLDFVAGANITSLTVVQQFDNETDWAAPKSAGAANGYLSGSILLGIGTSVNMQYKPSHGNAAQSILNVTNTTGQYAQFNNTIQLLPANNTDNGLTGNDQIIINILNLPGSSSISNVQVIPLTANITNLQYDQAVSSRQIANMSSYFDTQFASKPIKSYLVGWDFPLNPAQALGWTQASVTLGGANLSTYILDQTIMYQSVDNSVAVSQTTAGCLQLTANTSTQIALVQYLTLPEIQTLLASSLSSVITGYTTETNGIPCTLSLWYTTGATLPSVASGTNLSIVSTLSANGYPTAFNQASAVAWTEIPRNGNNLGLGASSSTVSLLGNATFTMANSTTSTLTSTAFSGWDQVLKTSANTATYFAIVVGFGALSNTKSIVLKSISLVPGNIATVPGPQTEEEVSINCSAYYQKSFIAGTVPATQILPGAYQAPQTNIASSNSLGPPVDFPVFMRATPIVTLFNPINNNAQIYNAGSAPGDWSLTITTNVDATGFATAGTTNVGSSIGNSCIIQWTADARLGIV